MRKVALALCMVIFVAVHASPAWAQGGLDQRVSELSQQIAAKISAKQKTTVAVVEFTDLQGNVTDFGRFLAEELVTRLGDLEKFKVIERQLLNKIIAEQKLSLTGIVDPASAKQLGKILGVDAIVAGSVTNLAQSVRVNARLISAETGEVFATAAADIFKDESVTGLLAGQSVNKKESSQSSPPVKSQFRVNVRDFIVDLKACRMLATSLLCSLTVTNDSSSDREVEVYAGSSNLNRLVDEFGGEYVAKELQLGADKSDGWWGKPSAQNTLVPHVAVKLLLSFPDVNREAKNITLLRTTFQWHVNSTKVNLNADFKDIPITK